MVNDTIQKITEFLFIGMSFEELTFYDLVIVLGNNFYDQNVDVLEQLLVNHKIDGKTKVILSGNKGKLNKNIDSTEAEIMAEKIKQRNLDLNVILEKRATNIRENLVYSKEIAGNIDQYKQILIIGKSFAARRILMCADFLGFNLNNVHIYGFEVDIKKDDWHKNLRAKKRVLGEIERIGKYTLKNDLKL